MRTSIIVTSSKENRRYNVPMPAIQWVMTAYALALAAVIPLTGWATDRFGGKRLWMASVAMFLGGSVLCGLAWSAGSLIVFRVLQGLGGAVPGDPTSSAS